MAWHTGAQGTSPPGQLMAPGCPEQVWHQPFASDGWALHSPHTYFAESGHSRRRRWWPSAPGMPRQPPRPLR